jgi:hypothetical protein
LPSGLTDTDRDLSLARLGDGESGGVWSRTGAGDLDLDGVLETDRARSPRGLGFPAVGERLRTGLLLYPPPLPRSLRTGLREMLRLLLLYLLGLKWQNERNHGMEPAIKIS